MIDEAKKILELDCKRSDFSSLDLYKILTAADEGPEYSEAVEKAAEMISAEDLEELCKDFSTGYEIYDRVFSSSRSCATPKTKSLLLTKNIKLLNFATDYAAAKSIGDCFPAFMEAYKKECELNPTSSEAKRGKEILDKAYPYIIATPETVDYIIKTSGYGQLAFMRWPYNAVKDWEKCLNDEDKKIIDFVQNLSYSANEDKLNDFFKTVSPLFSKSNKTYNAVVGTIRDNVENSFQQDLRRLSDSKHVQIDELENQIFKYKRFMNMLEKGLQPYQEKYASQTSQDNL